MAELEDKKHSVIADHCSGKETNAVLDDFNQATTKVARSKINGINLTMSHGAVVSALTRSASNQPVERIQLDTNSKISDMTTRIKSLTSRKLAGHSCADDLVVAWQSVLSREELLVVSHLLREEVKSNPALAPVANRIISVNETMKNMGETIDPDYDSLIKSAVLLPEIVGFIETVQEAQDAGIRVHLAAGNYNSFSDRGSNILALANTIVVGSINDKTQKVDDYSRDGNGIYARTYHKGTHVVSVKPDGLDIDSDGKTDLSFEQIALENTKNQETLSITNSSGEPLTQSLEGLQIAGTSFAVPQNAGKTGTTFPALSTTLRNHQVQVTNSSLDSTSLDLPPRPLKKPED